MDGFKNANNEMKMNFLVKEGITARQVRVNCLNGTIRSANSLLSMAPERMHITVKWTAGQINVWCPV